MYPPDWGSDFWPTMTPRDIPLLLTLDVHGHPNLRSILLSSAEEFSDAGERVTYFISADLIRASRSVSQALRELASAGHSVGCHGLDHDIDPFTLTEDTERESLTLATEILEDSLGSKVKCYRAPDFRLTPRTLPILQDLGYEADCSVTSRRLPILSSCPWCFGWIVAPSIPIIQIEVRPLGEVHYRSWKSPLRASSSPWRTVSSRTATKGSFVT